MKNWSEILIEFLVKLVLIWLALCLCIWAGKKAFAYELTEPCDLSETELSEELPEALAEYASNFLQAEQDYGVSALLMASIAKVESNGTSILATKHGNLFGIKHAGKYIHWEDKNGTNVYQSINHAGWVLKTRFLANGCRTIEDIGATYCGSDEWNTAVKGEYLRLLEYRNNLLTERQNME